MTRTTSAGERTGRRSGSSWRKRAVEAVEDGRAYPAYIRAFTALDRLLPSSTALDDHHRHDPVPCGLEPALRIVQGAQHSRFVAVGELRARRDAPGGTAHHDERAGHLTAVHVRVGMPGHEQLLEQRQAAFLAQVIEGLEDLGDKEPAQQLVAADPLE